MNIKPQCDKYTFERRPRRDRSRGPHSADLGCATGHPSFVMSNSQAKLL